MVKIFIAVALLAIIGTVISTTCKDGSTCPGTTTCCLSPQGVGCCPYENASCCADGEHCCPSGYKCDLARSQCVRGTDSFLSFVSLNESSPAKLFESQPIVTSRGLPNVTDLLKCLTEGNEVVTHVVEAVKEYKKGTEEGKKKALEILTGLLASGLALGQDCYKVVQELLQ